MTATAKFYLVSNPEKRDPDFISSVDHVHVKTKTDGTHTLIISEENISDQSVEIITQEDAQSLIDSWISDENHNIERDIDGNDIVITNINLEVFLEDA